MSLSDHLILSYRGKATTERSFFLSKKLTAGAAHLQWEGVLSSLVLITTFIIVIMIAVK